jgi:hypothetical protein
VKSNRNHHRIDKYDTASVGSLLRTQDHVATRRQLLELGFPEQAIRERTTEGGLWQRILPSTYLAQAGPPSRRQLMRSALLYSTSDRTRGALLTGTAALPRSQPTPVAPGRGASR